MLLKLGVDISRLNREIRRTLNHVDIIVTGWTSQEAIVTSTYEGNHSPGSLHYNNGAYDIRVPGPDTDEILEEIKKKIGKDFDVEWEPDHIHIEYDPK